MMMFRPPGLPILVALIPWLTPWATDLSPLRGFFLAQYLASGADRFAVRNLSTDK